VDSSGYYLAVSVLPLADVSAIYLAAPIYVTGMSALFLGEQVGWRRWSAVLVGFAGVLIALRPGGATLSPYALAALAGSLAYAVMIVSTRRLRGVPNTVLVFTQVSALFVATMVTAPGWVLPTPMQAVKLALVAVISMGGFLCMNRGVQLAMASVIAPFQYSSIIWAVLLGWVVFGDIPGAAVVTGSAVIIAAGLFIALRERRLGR
jgi:drug/metabolite transporter (DMT)-like permease